MSSEEERLRRQQKLKRRNLVQKEMRENTGAFSLKVINSKKKEYKRKRINPRSIEEYLDDNEE